MEPVVSQELSPRQRRAFALARRAAGKVLRRRVRLFRLIRSGFRKLSAHEDALGQTAAELSTLLRLARSWVRREYRSVPWRSVLYAVAALVYFVNPVDLIPDALVGLGFADDIAVVGAVVRALRKDLDKFRSWEAAKALPAPPTNE